MGFISFFKSTCFTKRRIKYSLAISVVVWLLLYANVLRNRSNLVKSPTSSYTRVVSNLHDQTATNKQRQEFTGRNIGEETFNIQEKRQTHIRVYTSDRGDLASVALNSIPDGHQVTNSSIRDTHGSNRDQQRAMNTRDQQAHNTTADMLLATSKNSSHSHKHSSYGHCESNDFKHFDNVIKTSIQYFTKEFKVVEEPINSWLKDNQTLCGDSVEIYGNRFGLLHDVVINPRDIVDFDKVAKGGEGIDEVKSQAINKEDYKFNRGIFAIECNDSYANTAKTSGYERLRQLKLVSDIDTTMLNGTKKIIADKYTIAIAREDYANFWNHMFEMYGVFILMMVFNIQPEEVSIMFLDGHPSCMLDKNWEHIFGPVTRVGRMEGPVLYKHLIWGLAENKIPLSKFENPGCPYIEEFRTFLLNQYDIVENAKKLNCKRMTFTFIVRRNQVYHPRNLEGNIERKILNELDVIESLMNKFPGVCIQALLMESIPMRAQLEIISETDVLVGMHGAGMMHTTFLPRHAGVVELFPLEWRKTRPFSIMYEILALKWRKLKYGYWQNSDRKRQFSERVTIVDTEKVISEVKGVLNKMCS